VPDQTYDDIGVGYASVRRPDPRIAQVIRDAIGEVATLVNVGAGSGSYEPTDLAVVAVEPSEVMVAQRGPAAAPVVRAIAERLPFAAGTFDVASALLTIHHWKDPERGIAELQRVSRRQVILTWDPEVTFEQFWFVRDYFPVSYKHEQGLTTLDEILRIVGRDAHVATVPVPADCTDGFYAAYWARPEAYLDPNVRAGISAFALNDQAGLRDSLAQLASDLQTGAWEETYGHLRSLESIDAGYRLVTT
jgi:SAM-dependent methyltransferase